jgi:pyruvate dehydrogenase E2 component (dihydrolipoamide acetyltransferase)
MEVRLPNLGEGADSGTVVSILVKPGAVVKKGQNLIELETGKAVSPIPSPAAGTVGKIAVKEGDKLGVGQVILVLEGAGGAAEAPAAASKPAAPAETRGGAKAPAPAVAPAPVAVAVAPRAVVAPAAAVVTQTLESDFREEIVNENPAAGPYVRRVARDVGIDLRFVVGTGKSGQITVTDLRGYVDRLRQEALRPKVVMSAEAVVPPVPSGPVRPAPVSIDFGQWGPVTRKPMSRLRQTIAERMVESATTLPTVTQFDEADVSGLNELRKRHAGAYEAKGAKLTPTSFVLKAVAATLKKHPIFNASIDDATSEIVFKEYVHLGLAVDTEAGLLVPVIREADTKDLATLSKDVQELAARARERKLGLADMQGGTFTISNQGGIGGAHFTPVINKPEVAILGLGRTQEKPVVRDGQVVIRAMLPLALSYDHRLIDGGSAARFMVDLVAALAAFRDEDVKI